MGRKWTEKEIDHAIKLYVENKISYSEIGRRIDRSPISVRTKLLALGIAKENVRKSASLWSVMKIRKYIIDIDEAKNITTGTHREINVKCPDCELEKTMRVQNLVNHGFSCNCTTGMSYPELFTIAYFNIKNIDYEYQVSFDDSQRKIDFKVMINREIIYIETHGIQHFDKNSKWYKRTQESDLIKRQWAKDNNKKLIELDCRESSFDFIKNIINKCELLPNITDNEVPKILEYIQMNKKYPIKEIVEMYQSGKSTTQIAEELGLYNQTIYNMLIKNNVNIHENGYYLRKKVKCLETNIVFDSTMDAQRKTGIANSSISSCANGKLKSAGKHSITGDKLTWEYVYQSE